MTVKKAQKEYQLDPDRIGREILGLSLTGFHEIAYVDWGPVKAACLPCAFTGSAGRTRFRLSGGRRSPRQDDA